jgi:hypothetical protein
MIRLPFKILTAVMEMVFSRRGLPITFFVIAAGLALATCLRPPLSRDISSVRIPLGLWKARGPTAEQVFDGSRGVPYDSAGVFLIALCAAGVFVVLVAPKRFPQAAGVLVCGSIIAVAAVAINHPALVQLLDREYEQREQIVDVVKKLSSSQPVVIEDNGRVSEWNAPAEDERPGDLVRGWIYLRYGMYLVTWAILGLLLGQTGALGRRLRFAGGWVLLGGVLACVVCFPRLYAEYKWSQAQQLEARCDYTAARDALAAAVDRCPEFEQLERTWLLRGKLDWREGRSTTEARFFRIYQITRDKTRPQAYATGQDLPWLISGTKSYREGGAPPNAGFESLGNPIRKPTTLDCQDFRRKEWTPPGAVTEAYYGTHRREQRQAYHLASALYAETEDCPPVVRKQAAQTWTDTGITFFMGERVTYLTGREYALEHRMLYAAYTSWEKAAQIDPSRRDCSFYLGLAQAAMDRERPHLARAQLAGMLTGLADVPLHAYIMSSLGDAYLEAGQMNDSRRSYAESYDVFNLPKKINIHAQKALGGL